MKFYYTLYELQPRMQKAEAHKGALLKVVWSEDKIGYSDLHPWPEFGDQELEDHLSELRHMKLTPLVEQAIWLASLDAVGRQEKRNLYENQPLLKNNALITKIDSASTKQLDTWARAGFTTVKIKAGLDLENEIGFINRIAMTHSMKIRLDFNSRLTWSSFEKYMKGLTPNAKRHIEYLEDPFPYEASAWKEARQIVPLAIDWELRKIPLDQAKEVEADIIILKPTHDDVTARVEQCVKWKKKMTVTSHMGHPLGVMQCAYIAQDLSKRFPGMMLDPGCLTFDVFETNEFNSLLSIQGPLIKKVGGWGIGFDFVLKSQKWNQLKARQ